MKPRTDRELIDLYERWSEEFYCAGFIHPDAGTVESFFQYVWALDAQEAAPLESFEQEMLQRFRALEGQGR